MFVLVARWPPSSTVSYILSNQAMASGNEGQGHLLIGCRCWVFDWQEGNAVSAGACQLSSCSEKTLQTHGGLLTQHVNIIYRSSKASLLSQQPCYSFPKSLLTQPHIFHKASQYTSHWWTYANIVKGKDQKEGNEWKKRNKSVPTYWSAWWSYGSSLTWYPCVALLYVHKHRSWITTNTSIE